MSTGVSHYAFFPRQGLARVGQVLLLKYITRPYPLCPYVLLSPDLSKPWLIHYVDQAGPKLSLPLSPNAQPAYGF